MKRILVILITQDFKIQIIDIQHFWVTYESPRL
jgi:hypothetical protein